MKLVLDTNILISALVKKGFAREFIFTRGFGFELFSPAYTLSEINKYKEHICQKANITQEQFYFLLETLFSYVKIINPFHYSSHMKESERLIKDKDDAPFLALAIAFNCPIWSDDKHFKKQIKVKIYNTKEIFSLL